MKKQKKDIMVIGFALFAMFFGAGNLIFPPHLGLTSGSQWLTGFASFTFADAALALVAILALVSSTGTLEGITYRIGKLPSTILGISIFLCLGPLLAIPRTAASTYELGVQPIFNTTTSVWFSIIFFAVVLVLAIRPSKVIDIIGNFLTPALFVALIALIVKGVVTPIGPISDVVVADNVFTDGILAGYQTMDVLAALIFTVLITNTVKQRNYTEQKEKISIVVKSGIVAVVGLVVVYGGLAYLGATTSAIYGNDISQANLLISIVKLLLGHGGVILLGIIVALACLTTAIGLTSSTAEYFEKLTKGKVKYSVWVIGICAFSAFVSNFGIGTIVSFASPILSIVYPAALTLIFLSFFSKKIKSDYVFKFATGGALIVSLMTVINPYVGGSFDFINQLPLSPFGFNWIVPTIVCGIVGFFIKGKKHETCPELEESGEIV